MGKLYKVGEYGEMKLGEFRKNIMQYTRNNLRSIISSSDPEIVEIAIDELTRRGEELKEGGIARLGFRYGGGIDRGFQAPSSAGQSPRGSTSSRDTAADRREQASVTSTQTGTTPSRDDFQVRDIVDRPAQQIIGGQSIDVIPGDERNKKKRELLEDIERKRKEQEREDFINTQKDPIPTGITRLDLLAKFANKFLPQKFNRQFYYDNVLGRTVTLPDGTVITFDEDNYSGAGLTYDQLRKAGVIGAYGTTEMGQNAIDARGGPGGDSPPIGPITIGPRPDDPAISPILPEEPISPFVPPKNRKLPFENYFVGSDASEDQIAYGKQMGVDPRMYGLTAFPAADGGRIGYAGGGITDLRQGYFLGKIVKKIGKGVKKIAKSPFGKAALLAGGAGLFGLGPFKGLQPFLFGNMGGPRNMMGTPGLLRNFFLKNPRAAKFSLSNIDPFKAISAFSILPLLTGTGQDKDDPNKFSRGEELDIRGIRNLVARGNLDRTEFPFMPEDFYATAADGGRIGFANGGNEDDETIRSQALSALTPYRINRSAGGGTGYAPVTMQTEGQDAIVSGDDQSGPMAQGTTLPNQMPMRSPMPMMNPMMARGMMNPMMMRGMMNPMMMRGMMGRGMPMMGGRMMANEGGIMMASAPDPMDARNDMMENIAREEFGKPLKDLTEDEIIQIEEMMDEMTKRKTSPRVMAQEGGMMDMGGMEKDYRNEGGFVAIGGQERADDVPARLSKNEFVFTADAVRNAGGGNIDKGAEIMENMMENLEAGGKVSEESQGLQGARAMFATQKRLGEVL